MSLTEAGIRWYAVKESLYSIWSSTFSVNIVKTQWVMHIKVKLNFINTSKLNFHTNALFVTQCALR